MNDKVEKLDVEVIKKLIEQASDTEMKYLLILETNYRPGSSFEDETEYEVLYGEVDAVKLEHRYNYPTENSVKWLLIPKTIPVIVSYSHRDDYEGCLREWKNIYVFTAEGWKVVYVY